MKVLRINAADTWPLRHKMLRPERPLEEAKFVGDELDQTFHLGAFSDNKLVSVASFYFENHPSLQEPYQYRLRGMATHPDYQRKGFSSQLLQVAFPIIKQNFCSLVWCNAREVAVGFYQQVGFEKLGERFEIPDIGPHYLMFKRLDS